MFHNNNQRDQKSNPYSFQEIKAAIDKLNVQLEDKEKYSSVEHEKARMKYLRYYNKVPYTRLSNELLFLPEYQALLAQTPVPDFLATQPTQETYKLYCEKAYKVRKSEPNKIKPEFLKLAGENDLDVAKKIMTSRLCKLLTPACLLDIYYAHRRNRGFHEFAGTSYWQFYPEASLLGIWRRDPSNIGKFHNSLNLQVIFEIQDKASQQKQPIKQNRSKPPALPIDILSIDPLTHDTYIEYAKAADELKDTNSENINLKFLRLSGESSLAAAKIIMTSRLSHLLPPADLIDIYYAHRDNQEFHKFVLDSQAPVVMIAALLPTLRLSQAHNLSLIVNNKNLRQILFLQDKQLEPAKSVKQGDDVLTGAAPPPVAVLGSMQSSSPAPVSTAVSGTSAPKKLFHRTAMAMFVDSALTGKDHKHTPAPKAKARALG